MSCDPDTSNKHLSPKCMGAPHHPAMVCQALLVNVLKNGYMHVYSPGAGTDNPLGSEFLYSYESFVTLVICCNFLSFNSFKDFITVFPI